MPIGQGAASKAAGKIESGNYGTAIALNGGGEKNQLHIISENLTPSNNYESSIHLDGTAGKKSLYATLNKYAGDLQIEMHYDGILSLMICTLGMSNQDISPISLGSGAYAHYIEPSSDLSQRAFNYYEEKSITNIARRRMTLGFEKSVSIHENSSCMINGFSIDINPERSTITFNLVPYSQDYDSGTNSASTNWDKPTADQLTFENAVVYLKPRDSFTIDSGNKVLIVDETGTGNITITLTEATYTGGELAQELATKINASALPADYRVTYKEETRRFHFMTLDSTLFNIEGVNATTTIEDVIGFPADSGQNATNESQVDARPIAYVSFVDGDKVGISSFSLSYGNGLSSEDQDSLSSNKIVEPERNELRTISGSIEIPRYQNDTFIKAANLNTTYMVKVKFTGSEIGGGFFQEFNLFLPSVKFESTDIPISGANILKQSLSFQASFPDYLDFINFFDASYFIQEDFLNGATGLIRAFAAHTDGLYFGGNTALQKFTKEDGISAVDTTAANIFSMRQYGNDLYIGESGGGIEKWDGSSLSISCDVGVGTVTAIQQYGDDLYVLEKTTGKVSKFDGSSWSLSCDTTLTVAQDLISFGGYLWVYGSDGANIDIYRFDGSSWTAAGVAVDVDAAAIGGFTIHKGQLFLGSKDKIFVWDGSSAWVEVADIGTNDITVIFSYKGELITIDDNDVIRLINLSSGLSQVMVAAISSSATSKAILYDGHVFIGTNASSLIIKSVQEIYFKLHNRTTANPL